VLTFLLCQILLASPSLANQNPFAGGWVLDSESSSLTFQTIKNSSKLETSSFASYQGEIDDNGSASVRIQLDSVDTKVDLRNVRMRFLLFETFKFAQATVTATVNPESISGLFQEQRIQLPLSFELDLHGVTQPLEVQTIVTVLASNQVSVASAAPISIPTSLFDLDEGVRKLEEAAEVTIVPMGSVSFNLVYDVSAPKSATASQSAESQKPVLTTVGASSALESQGEFSSAECEGRFEILSRTGSIIFRSGSSELDPESDLILAAIADIIQRCPALNVIIAGHTDSAGSEDVNQYLSEQRARSVVTYLTNNDINRNRMESVGYGESRPIAPNDTRANRERNRRIEFLVDKN